MPQVACLHLLVDTRAVLGTPEQGKVLRSRARPGLSAALGSSGCWGVRLSWGAELQAAGGVEEQQGALGAQRGSSETCLQGLESRPGGRRIQNESCRVYGRQPIKKMLTNKEMVLPAEGMCQKARMPRARWVGKSQPPKKVV